MSLLYCIILVDFQIVLEVDKRERERACRERSVGRIKQGKQSTNEEKSF